MARKKNNKNKNYTPYYIWGLHASIAALKNNNRNIMNIFCTQLVFDKFINEKVKITNSIKIFKNNDLNALLENKITHQGIILETKPLNYPTLDDVIDSNNIIIALDQVTDPQNVGAIIRTFNFFGGKNLLITKDHSSEINGSLAKSASGALEYVNIIKVTNLSMTLKKMKKKGFIVIGLDENSDVMLHTTKGYDNEKKLLVMGSEGKGLRRLTKENCDFLVSIANNNDSDFNTLNVSVSSALALYEFMGRDIKK
ncbi:23S rRNA (guanosine(2251)-2'-O)-methyltransferase RlmB [OCS116 cluster bacterium]|nr:23S rRNA (guanosine(2251)-2'-O)-methyltransferase RlmB [OCS116 cluster bacterium]